MLSNNEFLDYIFSILFVGLVAAIFAFLTKNTMADSFILGFLCVILYRLLKRDHAN
jgi:ABC-type uncharacterized transport system permease subunit